VIRLRIPSRSRFIIPEKVDLDFFFVGVVGVGVGGAPAFGVGDPGEVGFAVVGRR
jgi:hypothetical protein